MEDDTFYNGAKSNHSVGGEKTKEVNKKCISSPKLYRIIFVNSNINKSLVFEFCSINS